ncbi:hypothetical protein IFR05_008155 [Cadophora sp. M221]|nr:hypothetical protein IFR05_008155 [Cadophora sp. M221]
MLDVVLEAHSSTANAHRIGHTDYDAYKAAERAYSVARSQHVKTAFARELKKFFEQIRSSSDGQADHAKGSTEERLDDAVQVDPGEGSSNTIDKMTTPDYSSEHETAITNNDLSMIDPQLFVSLDDGLQSILAEAVASDPSLVVSMDTVPIVSDGSFTQIRQTKRSKTVTMAITVLDSVSEVLLQNDVVLTDSELSDLMVTSFSNMFPSDNFFPGHEPLPGTTTCRFCDKDLLSSNKTRAVHTYWCAKKSLSEEIIRAVDTECIVPETCSWVGSGPKTQGKVCGAVIADSAASHLLSHSKVGVECRFGDCGQTEQAVLFKGSADLVTHIFKEHKILCTNAFGHRRAEMFVWWCSSCLAWIDGVKEDLNQHANGHIPLINDIIHHEGYTSLTVYDINFRPIFCPFCLHDDTLPETIRFKDFCCTGKAGYVKHVLAHLKALDDGGAACPAAKSSADGILCNCSSVEPMNAKELQDHLNQRHELDLSADERTSNKVVAIDSSGPPMKKRNTGTTGRRIALEPKSLNTQITANIKAGKKASMSTE